MQPESLARIVPVVLCGGMGKRLYPLSSLSCPKAFLRLRSRYSMIQNTLLRVKDCADPVIVLNINHQANLDRDLDEIGIRPSRIICEPEGRNTAPAICAAAMVLNPDTVMMILPCDHKIGNPYSLLQAALQATPFVKDGWIVSLGIAPRYAETGFGYIRRGEAVNDNIYRVDRFVEKPARAIARTMIRSGTCDWNSGILISSAGAILEEIRLLEPLIYESVRKSSDKGMRQKRKLYLSTDFCLSPALSIDFAVLERSNKILVQHTDLKWQDLGSWGRLARAIISG